MPIDYQTLDTLADVYIPILALLSLLSVTMGMVTASGRLASQKTQIIWLFILVIIVYGWMLLDQSLQIWLKMGMDYSTHTALALALVLFLSTIASHSFLPNPVWWLSLLAYLALMLWQQYHTVADMLSTLIVVLVTVALVRGLQKLF